MRNNQKSAGCIFIPTGHCFVFVFVFFSIHRFDRKRGFELVMANLQSKDPAVTTLDFSTSTSTL